MIRNAYAFFALIALLAIPSQAVDLRDSGIGFSKPNHFVKSSFSAGHVAVDVLAESRVDVPSLLADLDLSRSATAQDIADRVNAARKRLYPDEEIVLTITPSQKAAVAGEKVGLVRAILWWNNTNCSDCYWYAEYSSSIATMFIADIDYGAYNLYEKAGSGNYVFRYLVEEGGAATRISYGPKTTRGFRGYAAGVDSKADVVLYFFK